MATDPLAEASGRRRRGLGRSLVRGIAAALGVVLLGAVALAYAIRAPIVFDRPARPRLTATPSAARLEATVRKLSEGYYPRSYRDPAQLETVARWLASQLELAGLAPRLEPYTLREGTFYNVIAGREGREPELVIVGAHYDAYGVMPGADDNASGVAVLLELARVLPRASGRRSLDLVAYCTEEPPFFGGDDMGSARHAQALQQRGARVELMIALDTLGYYSDASGSQDYPLPGLGLLLPGRGDFVAVVGDMGSGRSIARVKRGLRAARGLRVVSLRAPAALPGVDWSDHLSFRTRGWPAVLVTDTAFLRNPSYHRPSDTADRLDYVTMARLVEGLAGVLEEVEALP